MRKVGVLLVSIVLCIAMYMQADVTYNRAAISAYCRDLKEYAQIMAFSTYDRAEQCFNALSSSYIVQKIEGLRLDMECISEDFWSTRKENYKKARKELARISQHPETLRCFKFYETKAREFLANLGCLQPAKIRIYPMAHDDTIRSGGYATWGSKIIFKLPSNNSMNDVETLFTCAHEAAHHACGHVGFSGKVQHSLRTSLDIEREADSVAARMLCAYGYRWVVEEYVKRLAYAVQIGHEHRDGIHPSYKESYYYLSAILAEKSAFKKPSNFAYNSISLMACVVFCVCAWHLENQNQKARIKYL